MPKPTRGSMILAALLLVALPATVLFLPVQETRELVSWQRLLYNLSFAFLIFLFLRMVVYLFLSFADSYFKARTAEPATYPLVSVIVPCFNEEAVVQHAARSLLNLDYPNFEIIVVDDGSTDLTLLNAKEMESERNIRVIYQRNKGKAEALNRGISEALGEFVLCVDADSILEPDAIRKGIVHFEGNDRLAAVAGNVRIGNVRSILPRFQSLEYVIGLNMIKTSQSFLSTVTIVPGPVGLFRKEAILKIGGYRSETFAEDSDLTIRLLLGGYRIVYCADMVAVTEAPEDFTSLIKQRYRWSRGTIQAIRINSGCLWKPFSSPRNFVILTYLALETLVIPNITFILSALCIQSAVVTGNGAILSLFFMQITLLDLAMTAYCAVVTPEIIALVSLAALNRLTYGLALEIIRFFSSLDELLSLPMNWNKLQRKGL